MKTPQMPSNSDELLLEMADCKNPSQRIIELFDGLPDSEANRLRSLIGELQNRNYVKVIWADNVPYTLSVTTNGRNHIRQSERIEENNRGYMNMNRYIGKVFVVHGHDDAALQEMARTLEKGHYEPIILNEQPNAGMTIIEKIEECSDVCYAVILYTECDVGREKSEAPAKNRFRARQNVIFEHGYLIGRLGRKRVSAFVKGNVETPGDIDGVVYIPMDSAGAWKTSLAKEMQNVGLPVDMNEFLK